MNSISKINLENGIFTYEIFYLLFFIGLYNLIKCNFNKYINKLFTYISNLLPYNKPAIIEILGWEFLSNNIYSFDYPYNMKAINYYVYSNLKSKQFRYFNNERNSLYYSDDIQKISENYTNPNYILSDTSNIKVDDNIFLSLDIENIDFNNSQNPRMAMSWKITIKLLSYKYSQLELQKFINYNQSLGL